MTTMERFHRLMATLDLSGRASLSYAAKKLLDGLGHLHDRASDGPPNDAADRIVARLGQIMDLIEADAYLGGEYENGGQRDGQIQDAARLPDRLLGELELWVEASRRLRPRKLPPGRPRGRTVCRLQRLMPSMDSLQRDCLVDGASRLSRSWRDGWNDLEQWERTIGVWRILCTLNEQMDAMERGMECLGADVAESGADGQAVTLEMAIEIATRKRDVDPTGVPEGWTCATKVTEEPPPGLYRVWDDEPAWYVWFLPRFFGLGSSEVLVVSKRTGRVLGRGSAGDEG